MWEEDSFSSLHFLHLVLSKRPTIVDAVSGYSAQLTTCIASCPRPVGPQGVYQRPSNEELTLLHTWCGSMFAVPPLQLHLNLGPTNTWWDWSCWFETEEWTSWSLWSQDFHFLITLNPTVTRDAEECNRVPTRQGIQCPPTFRAKLHCYPWCHEDPQIWLSIYRWTCMCRPFLCTPLQRLQQQKCLPGTQWYTCLVKKISFSLVAPHITRFRPTSHSVPIHIPY